MGKKRIIKKSGGTMNKALRNRSASKLGRRKLAAGILCVEATFNNTKAILTDDNGNMIFGSSAGSLGFKGAKKGTPFAAGKVGELLGEKAKAIGVKEVDVVVKGVGSGREPTIRSFMAHGIELKSIKDRTPVPHNGTRPRKARRV
jgi:small subunit ribosomal protein S11